MRKGDAADLHTLVFGILTLGMAVAAYAILVLTNETETVRFFLPVCYILLGALIKYGDQAYDEGIFSRRSAMLLAFPSGIMLGTLMAYDNGTATIGLGLLFSLLIAGKYDNLGFVIGFLITISISLVAMMMGMGHPDLMGIILVGLASFVDEWADTKAECMQGPARAVLMQRPFLKVMVLLLCAFGILDSWAYLPMFLGFDFGYSFMECFSHYMGGAEDVPS